MVRQPRQSSTETTDVPQVRKTPALPSTGDFFSCPQEGCVRVFQRLYYETALSLEACELFPEKYCILDLAKQEYASHLQEGTGLVPSLQVPASYVSADKDQGYKDDWA